MDTQLLKLDKPYNYIYCNGSMGLHIATLIVYEANVDENGEYQLETHSHPVVRYLNGPEGAVWNKAELRNCEVICSEDDMKIPLERFGRILYSQWRSEDELEPGYSQNVVLKRALERYGIEVVWPVDKDGKELTEFDVRLSISKIVKKPYNCVGFNHYFFFHEESRVATGLYEKLYNSRSWIYALFEEHHFRIRFFCNDPKFKDLVSKLNNSDH